MADNTSPAANGGIIKRIGTVSEAAPPWSWLDMTNSFFILVIFVLLFGTLFGFLFVNILFGEMTTELQGFATVLGWLIGGLVTVVTILRLQRRNPETWAALKLQQASTPIPFLLLLGLGVAVFLDVVGLVISGDITPVPQIVYLTPAVGVFGWVVNVLFVIIAQPAAEELVFRGVIQPFFRARAGAWGGLAVTSLVFAVFHFAAFASLLPADTTDINLIWKVLILPYLLSMIMGAVRVVTGSTRATIVTRAGAGIFMVIAALVIAG